MKTWILAVALLGCSQANKDALRAAAGLPPAKPEPVVYEKYPAPPKPEPEPCYVRTPGEFAEALEDRLRYATPMEPLLRTLCARMVSRYGFPAVIEENGYSYVTVDRHLSIDQLMHHPRTDACVNGAWMIAKGEADESVPGKREKDDAGVRASNPRKPGLR